MASLLPFWAFALFFVGETLAFGSRSRILQGSNAKKGQFPSQLSVQNQGKHFCGGTLINPWIGITAAHCCEKMAQKEMDVENVRIVAGEHVLSTPENEQIRKLTNFLIHPDYSPYFHDICLLYFEEPLRQDDEFVQTTKLASKTPSSGAKCFIVGWGTSVERIDAPTEDILQFAQVPILSDTICQESYGSRFDKSIMICAGYKEGGIDSCQGDSGGPLICNNKLVGVVSFGSGCGRPGYPGVYTKISSFKDWISENSRSLRYSYNNGNQNNPSILVLLVLLFVGSIE